MAMWPHSLAYAFGLPEIAAAMKASGPLAKGDAVEGDAGNNPSFAASRRR
jgi:hypothetical protein